VQYKNDLAFFNFTKGDQRINEQPMLAILQIIWAREHNRLARELKRINPHWSDETLFQVRYSSMIRGRDKVKFFKVDKHF